MGGSRLRWRHLVPVLSLVSMAYPLLPGGVGGCTRAGEASAKRKGSLNIQTMDGHFSLYIFKNSINNDSKMPRISAGHVSESEVTSWDGAGERQHFLLHLSLDLTERETKPKSNKETAFLHTYK